MIKVTQGVRMKSIFGEGIELLNQVIEETKDGYKLRTGTRHKIIIYIKKCEEMSQKFRQIHSEQWEKMDLKE